MPSGAASPSPTRRARAASSRRAGEPCGRRRQLVEDRRGVGVVVTAPVADRPPARRARPAPPPCASSRSRRRGHRRPHGRDRAAWQVGRGVPARRRRAITRPACSRSASTADTVCGARLATRDSSALVSPGLAATADRIRRWLACLRSVGCMPLPTAATKPLGRFRSMSKACPAIAPYAGKGIPAAWPGAIRPPRTTEPRRTGFAGLSASLGCGARSLAAWSSPL